MTRGGHRVGAGRPKGTTGAYKEPNERAKKVCLYLYDDEIPYIKGIIKRLHEQKRQQQKEPTQ